MLYFAHHSATHSAESNTVYFVAGLLAITLAVAFILRKSSTDE